MSAKKKRAISEGLYILNGGNEDDIRDWQKRYNFGVDENWSTEDLVKHIHQQKEKLGATLPKLSKDKRPEGLSGARLAFENLAVDPKRALQKVREDHPEYSFVFKPGTDEVMVIDDEGSSMQLDQALGDQPIFSKETLLDAGDLVASGVQGAIESTSAGLGGMGGATIPVPGTTYGGMAMGGAVGAAGSEYLRQKLSQWAGYSDGVNKELIFDTAMWGAILGPIGGGNIVAKKFLVAGKLPDFARSAIKKMLRVKKNLDIDLIERMSDAQLVEYGRESVRGGLEKATSVLGTGMMNMWTGPLGDKMESAFRKFVAGKIKVMPDFRLSIEKKGKEVLDKIADFYKINRQQLGQAADSAESYVRDIDVAPFAHRLEDYRGRLLKKMEGLTDGEKELFQPQLEEIDKIYKFFLQGDAVEEGAEAALKETIPYDVFKRLTGKLKEMGQVKDKFELHKFKNLSQEGKEIASEASAIGKEWETALTEEAMGQFNIADVVSTKQAFEPQIRNEQIAEDWLRGRRGNTDVLDKFADKKTRERLYMSFREINDNARKNKQQALSDEDLSKFIRELDDEIDTYLISSEFRFPKETTHTDPTRAEYSILDKAAVPASTFKASTDTNRAFAEGLRRASGVRSSVVSPALPTISRILKNKKLEDMSNKEQLYTPMRRVP